MCAAGQHRAWLLQPFMTYEPSPPPQSKAYKLKEEESLGGESYGHFCACFVKAWLWAFTEYWSSWLFEHRNAVNPASWVRRLNKKESYWVVQNYTARQWWRQGIPNTLPATLTIYSHWLQQHLYSLKVVIQPGLFQKHTICYCRNVCLHSSISLNQNK